MNANPRICGAENCLRMGDACATPDPSPQCHDSANQCSAAYGWYRRKTHAEAIFGATNSPG